VVIVEAGSSVEVHSRMVYSLEERIFILEQYIEFELRNHRGMLHRGVS